MSAPLRGAVLLEIARMKAACQDLVSEPFLQTAVSLILQQPDAIVVRINVPLSSLRLNCDFFGYQAYHQISYLHPVKLQILLEFHAVVMN